MAFFKDFGEVELWEVVRVGSWQTIEPGTVLMREGEPGDSFYSWSTARSTSRCSASRSRCSSRAPASARCSISPTASSAAPRTITARGKVIVMQIKFAALRIASDACQNGFHKAFMRVLVERLAKANRLLAQPPA